MGKFLSLKAEGVETVQLCDRMWFFLDSIEAPKGFRSSIVQAIASKLDVSFPGIYDGSRYDDPEE
jgi:hypothetical protein